MTRSRGFGSYLRHQREQRRGKDAAFSVRQVAARVGIEPSYLSKIERGEQPPPSEETIAAIARELDEDTDVLLALAGKVSSDLQAIIRKRPALFAQLIRELRHLPDHAVLRVVREVRDGEW
ncbi:MAG TPA: helix-turn-helix transcriptional regulator [Vicinamibacterales bacterium]|nr:helix-turn-helix transcriptional regulator [Vicinamibacterales bacterium]